MRQLSPAAPALLLGTLAALLRTALSVDHVPMLLWSTQRSEWSPDTALHEGHIVSAPELRVLLEPVFTQNSRNLILFLQDTLSIDDFTYLSESYGNKNPFQNVQDSISTVDRAYSQMLEMSPEADWYTGWIGDLPTPGWLELWTVILRLTAKNLNSIICKPRVKFLVIFNSGEVLQETLTKEILQSSPSSLVLPAVDCEAVRYLLSFLQESGDWKSTYTTNLNFSQLELDTSKPNLLLVQLQPLVSGSSEISTQEAIAENDKIIGRLTMDLQERGLHFSVIYTAVRPSRISRRTDVVWGLRRQLMATEEEDSSSYIPLNVTSGNDTCILFYASNFSLTVNSSISIDLTNATFVTQNVNISSSECSDSNTTLSLKYTNPVSGISSLEIRFIMIKKFYTVSARYWFTVDSVEIVQDEEKLAKFNASVIYAPAEYSFHCQLVGTDDLYPGRLIAANDEAENWDVFISRFQIQGFNIEDSQFSYASDCTGFFTAAIWMGLVTSVALVGILTYGIHMILQLTTNSRFDDPKGPALSVPQTE